MLDREHVYFVVWCEGGGSPTVKHTSYATATNEAKRLARANPGQRFAVLAAVQAYERNDLRTVEYLGLDGSINDEIPF